MRNPPEFENAATRAGRPKIQSERPDVASRLTTSSRKTKTQRNCVALDGDSARSERSLSASAAEPATPKECELPQHSVISPDASGHYLGTLRQFRTMTFCAAMTLLGAFFIFAFNRANGLPISLIAVGLAALIELLGGTRLLKSHRNLGENKAASQIEYTNIVPRQVHENERQLRRDEPAPLYSNCRRDETPQIGREARQQKIQRLLDKSSHILSRVGRFEEDGLHSESVLSFDRAVYTVLSAVLLSTGIETRGTEHIEGWLPHLERILRNTKLEDIAYLEMLRNRINKGYDATLSEAQRAEDIAEPIIDDALEYLTTNPTRGEPQSHSSPPTSLARGASADPLSPNESVLNQFDGRGLPREGQGGPWKKSHSKETKESHPAL